MDKVQTHDKLNNVLYMQVDKQPKLKWYQWWLQFQKSQELK